MAKRAKAWNRWVALRSTERVRLRVKFGQHEFEADGPSCRVTIQFDDFMQMVRDAHRYPRSTTEAAKAQAGEA